VNLRRRSGFEAFADHVAVAPIQLFAQHLAAQPGFELLQLLVDGVGLLLVAHHVFAVTLQEVTDGLHANPDGTRRLVFVDIL
jgi:hypothetical protein